MALPEPIPPLDSKASKEFRKRLKDFQLTPAQKALIREHVAQIRAAHESG